MKDSLHASVQWHHYVGTTGKGRNSVMQQLAEREGVSYEEIESRFQPTPEELRQLEKERHEARQAEESRLQAVRDAYWANSDESEFDSLHDSISIATGASPTSAQVRQVFNMLPAEIIGAAIQWGMSDTSVRDDASLFIEENHSKVRATLGI